LRRAIVPALFIDERPFDPVPTLKPMSPDLVYELRLIARKEGDARINVGLSAAQLGDRQVLQQERTVIVKE